MSLLSRILLFVAICTIPANAQIIEPVRVSPFGHIVHYVKTHKELLASDAVILASFAADSASSVHCQDVRPVPCIEENPILSHHPSQLATWGLLMGMASVVVAADHGIVYGANHGWYPPEARHEIWLQTAAIAGVEGPNVWNNVCAAEHDQAASRLQKARERLADGS